MKKNHFIGIALGIVLFSCDQKSADNQTATVAEPASPKHLFMDVHNLGAGKVTAAAVAEAHKKDLATEGKFNVHFIKYWVDEINGKVYCLAESPDSASVYNTHKEAHGLTPDRVAEVAEGQEADRLSKSPMFFDIHRLGKVKASDVAEAHKKDLAVQGKYKVNFIDYWVDEKEGVVMCVAEAPDSAAMVKTHKEAHGLIPDEVHPVTQGN